MKTLPILVALIGLSIQAADKPNIVLFLVDDMGWMDSTPYGSKYYETPNMDKFAKQSMLFTDAYAHPLCSPTRASILSGHSIHPGTELPPPAATSPPDPLITLLTLREHLPTNLSSMPLVRTISTLL